jgi:hypothetical protein
MLVDAKHDEHEFGDDARQDHAHEGAKHAYDQQDHADERIIRHRRQRTHCAGATEQDGNHDREPIEDLDHGGRHEPLPLEQIAEAEHDSSWQSCLIPAAGGTLHRAIAAVNRGRSTPQFDRLSAAV